MKSINDRLNRLEEKALNTIPDSETCFEGFLELGDEPPTEIFQWCVCWRGGQCFIEDRVRPTTSEDIAGWQSVWEGKNL
jgi:hypothetical protein